MTEKLKTAIKITQHIKTQATNVNSIINVLQKHTSCEQFQKILTCGLLSVLRKYDNEFTLPMLTTINDELKNTSSKAIQTKSTTSLNVNKVFKSKNLVNLVFNFLNFQSLLQCDKVCLQWYFDSNDSFSINCINLNECYKIQTKFRGYIDNYPKMKINTISSLQRLRNVKTLITDENALYFLYNLKNEFKLYFNKIENLCINPSYYTETGPLSRIQIDANMTHESFLIFLKSINNDNNNNTKYGQFKSLELHWHSENELITKYLLLLPKHNINDIFLNLTKLSLTDSYLKYFNHLNCPNLQSLTVNYTQFWLHYATLYGSNHSDCKDININNSNNNNNNNNKNNSDTNKQDLLNSLKYLHINQGWYNRDKIEKLNSKQAQNDIYTYVIPQIIPKLSNLQQFVCYDPQFTYDILDNLLKTKNINNNNNNNNINEINIKSLYFDYNSFKNSFNKNNCNKHVRYFNLNELIINKMYFITNETIKYIINNLIIVCNANTNGNANSNANSNLKKHVAKSNIKLLKLNGYSKSIDYQSNENLKTIINILFRNNNNNNNLGLNSIYFSNLSMISLNFFIKNYELNDLLIFLQSINNMINKNKNDNNQLLLYINIKLLFDCLCYTGDFERNNMAANAESEAKEVIFFNQQFQTLLKCLNILYSWFIDKNLMINCQIKFSHLLLTCTQHENHYWFYYQKRNKYNQILIEYFDKLFLNKNNTHNNNNNNNINEELESDSDNMDNEFECLKIDASMFSLKNIVNNRNDNFLINRKQEIIEKINSNELFSNRLISNFDTSMNQNGNLIKVANVKEFLLS